MISLAFELETIAKATCARRALADAAEKAYKSAASSEIRSRDYSRDLTRQRFVEEKIRDEPDDEARRALAAELRSIELEQSRREEEEDGYSQDYADYFIR